MYDHFIKSHACLSLKTQQVWWYELILQHLTKIQVERCRTWHIRSFQQNNCLKFKTKQLNSYRKYQLTWKDESVTQVVLKLENNRLIKLKIMIVPHSILWIKAHGESYLIPVQLQHTQLYKTININIQQSPDKYFLYGQWNLKFLYSYAVILNEAEWNLKMLTKQKFPSYVSFYEFKQLEIKVRMSHFWFPKQYKETN